jgi:NADH:ubiquinone oxidoreductase subunit E
MDSDLDIIFKKFKQGKKEDLIPLLQEVQDVTGHISEESIIKIGKFLGLSTTKIYGLATFYDSFRFFPAGKIHIKICNGTTCYMNGSAVILNKIEELTGIATGQTTRNGNFSYEIVSCMGGCHMGPILNVNGEYHSHIKPEQLPELVRKLKYVIEND